MTSILDKLENSRIDVSTIVSAEDISGSCYKLDPKMYKYIMVIPVSQIEMQWVKYCDIQPYVSDLDYLFKSFTADYQILLRKTVLTIPSDYFIESPLKDNLLNNHPMMGPLSAMASNKYTGGIFIQFNTPRDWTYRKIYRFLVSLTNVLSRYEAIIGTSHPKDLYLYRRHSEEPEPFNNYWNEEILNVPLSKLVYLMILKKFGDMSANEIVTNINCNTKLLSKTVRRFIKPDFDNTPSEIKKYRAYIYNDFFRKTQPNVRVALK